MRKFIIYRNDYKQIFPKRISSIAAQSERETGQNHGVRSDQRPARPRAVPLQPADVLLNGISALCGFTRNCALLFHAAHVRALTLH